MTESLNCITIFSSQNIFLKIVFILCKEKGGLKLKKFLYSPMLISLDLYKFQKLYLYFMKIKLTHAH